MKVYLAGPMAGYPENNFPAFHKAAKELRDQGYEVLSPAELEKNENFVPSGKPTADLRAVLALDMAYICKKADAIALLPGWENSKGAFAEWALARALGLKFMYLS